MDDLIETLDLLTSLQIQYLENQGDSLQIQYLENQGDSFVMCKLIEQVIEKIIQRSNNETRND